ncbi:MAG: hypothetical protein HKN71_07800, partial [Gemmatimonadetes bacterium]|nr:hypothetical protein [Gemmatimonadota bacterium]
MMSRRFQSLPRLSTRLSRSHVSAAIVAALAIGSAGCRDAPSDPLASLVSLETAPAVAVPVELPSLAELAVRADVRDELGPVLDAWVAGWEEEDEDLGRGARDEAIRQATPALHDALGSGGVASTLQPLFEVGRDLGRIEDVPTDLVPRLEEVRSLIEDTRAALDAGRFDRALTAGLQASDRIRALGPRAVARTLISRADQALMRATVGEMLDPRSMSRGERLLSGARRALEEGEVDLAIQRGYYAVQV